MAKRWYLAPVTGTGTLADPYRAKLPVGTNHSAVIATDPKTGVPVLPWCLVKVARGSGAFGDLDGDGDLDPLPVIALDAKVSDLAPSVRTRFAAGLEKRGIDTSDVRGATTIRQIVRRVGRMLDADFHEDATDASE